MAHRSIERKRSRTFSSEGRLNVCIWSNYRDMHLISIPMRASGMISSALSWATSAVLISMTCLLSSFEQENVCDSNERSFAVAHDNVGTRFSFFSRDQFVQPLVCPSFVVNGV